MNDQDWREKYFAEVEQHEQHEKQWRAEKHDLQRLLVRACLAAEGQSSRLDDVLEQLRETARSNDPDVGKLRRLQERLEKVVAGFDEERATAISELRDALGRLVEPLQERASGETRRELKRFGHHSRNQAERFSSVPQVLGELASLQSRVLEEIDDTGTRTRPSWWRRLFGRGFGPEQPASVAGGEPGSGNREIAEHDAQPHLSSPVSEAGELELDIGDQDDSDDIQHVRDRLANLLYQIQSQIALPERAEARAESLLAQAHASREWEQVQAILDEVAHLIVAAVGRGQRDFKAFLSGLDERLVRIQSQFDSGALDLSSWREVTEHYDRQLHRELDDMGSRADTATDLSGLKSTVQEHLERLTATLDEYREAGVAREERLREEVRNLQDRVNAMEDESREVQKELQEERRRATTDTLTQLPNREALEERLQEEYKRWERYREPASLAMVDIDYFKTINDTYGHLAGDKVLQLLSKALRENLREPDYIARYGGEEFIVVLPATAAETAREVLDKLRERIRGLPFHFRHEQVEVTLSGGVVGFMEVNNPYVLVDIADRALYRAKEEGRNRIRLAQGEDFTPGVTRQQ